MKIEFEKAADGGILAIVSISEADIERVTALDIGDVSDLTSSSDIVNQLEGLKIIAEAQRERMGDKKKETPLIKKVKLRIRKIFKFNHPAK